MSDDRAIPAFGWQPRDYQLPAWSALQSGIRRAALSWHRRSGKDDVSLHWTARSMVLEVGTYWHMLPEASQARKAIWDAVNPATGKRRVDEAFPAWFCPQRRDHDMFLRSTTGSTWQVVGSDNFDSLVGSPPRGIVFSEYALADPNAWALLRPILVENGGWAIFISTVRGRNHFVRMLEFAKRDPTWFGQTLTVDDTGVIGKDRIEQERRELTAERGSQEADAIIAQEYYCDPDAPMPGSYYGALLSRADRDGRIGTFPWVPHMAVGTAWDIGVGDATVIWFFHLMPSGRVRIINVLEGSSVGLDFYAGRIHSLPYMYADHIWPHDGKNRDWSAKLSREGTAAEYGLRPRILTREADLSDEEGIHAARLLLATAEFNVEPDCFPGETPEDARRRMGRGLDALRMYRRKWDETNQRFSEGAVHDWTSNFADAFRYLAIGRKPFRGAPGAVSRQRSAEAAAVAVSDYRILG